MCILYTPTARWASTLGTLLPIRNRYPKPDAFCLSRDRLPLGWGSFLVDVNEDCALSDRNARILGLPQVRSSLTSTKNAPQMHWLCATLGDQKRGKPLAGPLAPWLGVVFGRRLRGMCFVWPQRSHSGAPTITILVDVCENAPQMHSLCATLGDQKRGKPLAGPVAPWLASHGTGCPLAWGRFSSTSTRIVLCLPPTLAFRNSHNYDPR